MKLPKSWTTVTLLSKMVAIVLFVSLPFVGFYLGIKYQASVIEELQQKIRIFENSAKQVQLQNNSDNQEVDEKAIGFIKKVYEKSSKRYLEIDYIQMFSGEAAIEAAMEDTGCSREKISNGDCAPSLNNGFYIRNNNSQIRIFEISNKAIIKSLKEENMSEMPVQFSYFKSIFSDETPEHQWLKTAPYNIEISGGIITLISQQYLP